jgi:hypothetical protein
MMTAHQKQIAAFIEMSEHYILATKSAEELEAIGQEIAVLKTELKASKDDLAETTKLYLKHRKSLSPQARQ